MCVTFVTCEVRVCGLRCRSGSSLYIYRVYLLTYLLPRRAAPQEQPGRAALSRVLRGHSLRRGPPPPLPRQALAVASDKKRGRDGTKYSKFHPRGYLSHHLAAISMAAVYTDAAHIADGVIGLKQRSLAASDPTA